MGLRLGDVLAGCLGSGDQRRQVGGGVVQGGTRRVHPVGGDDQPDLGGDEGVDPEVLEDATDVLAELGDGRVGLDLGTQGTKPGSGAIEDPLEGGLVVVGQGAGDLDPVSEPVDRGEAAIDLA